MPGFSASALAAFSFLIAATHAAPAGGNSFRNTGNFTAVASSTILANTTTTTAGTTAIVGGTAAASSIALDPNAVDCQLQVPANALTAEGLSTPWVLLAPCSQAVTTQQAFAEAAVLDPQGQLSVYHPLIIDHGKTAQAAPIVPNIAAGSQVILYFGFNGNTLTLVDTNGQDSNASPTLQSLKCVNGLPGAQGDVFGQVSWCNTVSFWEATNAAVASGKLQVPPLGTDNNGNQCISSHSFAIVDQDQSDNLPTKYLLLADGSTVQFTAANQAKFPSATEIDNASDEALIADFVDPVIGCTPFSIPSIDNPSTTVASMASQELQAMLLQAEPAALVPLNDPDTLLTSNGQMSAAKTNAYRLGVNMLPLSNGAKTDDGSPTAYCNNLIAIQPPFLAGFQTQLSNAQTPDVTVGNNLFTFLANRFLQSLTNLNCPNENIPVTCTLDGNGVATACSITATLSTGNGTTIGHAAGGGSVGSTATDLAPTSAFTMTTIPKHHLHRHGFGGHTIAANPHTFRGTAATTAVAMVTPTGVNAGNGTSLSSQLLAETGAASASQISALNATASTSSILARNGGGRNLVSTQTLRPMYDML